MDYNEIEQELIFSIATNDPHKVSKQLQIKQWTKLYGDKLLRSNRLDELHFVKQVISNDDCWYEVNSFEGVKLNRCKLGRKLLASKTPNGNKNPFDNIKKFQIACWYCLKDKITELGNQLEHDNEDTGHGVLVTYWTHVKSNENYYKWALKDYPLKVDNNMKLHYGFQSAIRDNNKEALKYFWKKLEQATTTHGQEQQKSLSEMDKNELLIYTATHYCLPFSKANNEKVGFVIDHLDKQQYAILLEKDFKENTHYSTLYNLISNFEFDNAKKLAENLSSEKISYFDYDTLRYRVLHQISSLTDNDNKFRDAGFELLNSLKMPLHMNDKILPLKEVFDEVKNRFIKLLARDGNYSPKKYLLSDTIESQLKNFLELRQLDSKLSKSMYNIHGKFDPYVVSNILHNTEVITLDQTKIEKASKRISSYGDDSSDEEDTVTSYDIKTALTKLQEIDQIQQDHQISDYNSSFIAHAVSIKLLYSFNIQKDYYQRKFYDLKYEKKPPTYVELCVAVDNSANHIVQFKDYTKQVVAYDICYKINANASSFLRHLLNKSLKYFFKELQRPEGKYHDDDLSTGTCYQLELGTCDRFVKSYSVDEDGRRKKLESDRLESNVNGVFDISDSSHFPTKFFSTLRLYNRIEKRRFKMSIDNSSEKLITWKYYDKIKVKIDNKRKNLKYRDDWVIFGKLDGASYKKIYNEVSFTMQDLDALSTIFTKGVEAVKEISRNAASLHYLLFGNEVIRNPSALIHNMMMLDLIKGGKLTWESALKGNFMPMSMEGSIMASRVINSLFNENYMPHKYLYEDKTYEEYSSAWKPENRNSFNMKNIDNAQKLINAEKKLTLAWCKMKWSDKDQYFDEKSDDIKSSKVEWLFNKLQKYCKTWYDIDIIGYDSHARATY